MDDRSIAYWANEEVKIKMRHVRYFRVKEMKETSLLLLLLLLSGKIIYNLYTFAWI